MGGATGGGRARRPSAERAEDQKQREIRGGFLNQVCKYHESCRFEDCKRWHPGQPEPYRVFFERHGIPESEGKGKSNVEAKGKGKGGNVNGSVEGRKGGRGLTPTQPTKVSSAPPLVL